MSTQVFEANAGNITQEVKLIAEKEGIDEKTIQNGILTGEIVILKNNQRKNSIPTAIGKPLLTKVNAAVWQGDSETLRDELDKVRVIEQLGADILTDLSTTGDFDKLRRKILAVATLPFGTVPIYQAAGEALLDNSNILKLSKDKIFETIEKHCADGVDFVVLHAGVTKFTLEQFIGQKNLSGLCSIGAKLHSCWIKATGMENPLYENFDAVLEILRKYDVTLRLASGFRANSVVDGITRAQVAELTIFGELVKRARNFGVQVMVDSIGHMPLSKIQTFVQSAKEIMDFAPLCAIEANVADIAVGYNHQTTSIGASIAAMAGADLICSNAPTGRALAINSRQIKEGIMAAKIAAHAADVSKGNIKATELEKDMACAIKSADYALQKDCALDKTTYFKIEKNCCACGDACSDVF